MDPAEINTDLHTIIKSCIHLNTMAIQKNKELIEALKGMNSGKVPEPDGLPTEIYKLLPHLLDVFNESCEKTSILEICSDFSSAKARKIPFRKNFILSNVFNVM